METTWIAEERVIFLHADGRKVPGRIAVGLPVQEDASEASCCIEIDGIQYNHQAMIGTSTLQALLLAVRYIGWRLHEFLSNGGRVLDPDEHEFTIDALFGPLLQEVNVGASVMDKFKIEE
jgi:hypothetical protein